MVLNPLKSEFLIGKLTTRRIVSSWSHEVASLLQTLCTTFRKAVGDLSVKTALLTRVSRLSPFKYFFPDYDVIILYGSLQGLVGVSAAQTGTGLRAPGVINAFDTSGS